MIEWTYRKCNLDDCEFILGLKDLCLRWYIEIIYGWDINVQRELTKKELSTHKDDMRIIIVDKKDVGVTTFYEENDEYTLEENTDQTIEGLFRQDESPGNLAGCALNDN